MAGPTGRSLRIPEDKVPLKLSSEEMALLEAVGFSHRESALGSLTRLAQDGEAEVALDSLLPALLSALARAPHPERVLVTLERLAQRRGDVAGLLRELAQSPRALEVMVTLFSGSQFLSEILLRHPEQLDRVLELPELAQPKGVEKLDTEARAAVENGFGDPSTDPVSALDRLRRFQRLELLRIGVCDLLGLLDLPTLTAQLSALADCLVRRSLDFVASETQISSTDFAVLALGKLGGGELNYSSDIDLVFLAVQDASRYEPLARRLIHGVSQVTAEGFLYRVDVRLRPWGRDGALVNTPAAYLEYLEKHSSFSEKQALLKARTVAGNLALGEEFLALAEPLIFGAPAQTARRQVRALKERIEADLGRRGRDWGEVKAGSGSIRDVEFTAQYLQLLHRVVCPNTLDTLAELHSGQWLSTEDYGALGAGYVFLRTVEHYLQLAQYRKVHSLPDDSEALAQLARRLRFTGPLAGSHFVTRYQQHARAIREIYERHLGEPSAPTPAEPAGGSPVSPHEIRMPPAYSRAFSAADIERHAALAQRLNSDNLVEVEAMPLVDNHWRVAVVGYDFLGELSIICGLLFVYGFNVLEGHVFTYEAPAPAEDPPAPRPRRKARRGTHRRRPPPRPRSPGPVVSRDKIVDVFTVRSGHAGFSSQDWERFAQDLRSLLGRLAQGQQRQAQSELAKRIALALSDSSDPAARQKLYPMDITVDNKSSENQTVLRIDAMDTVGFLYQFTNALALDRVAVKRMTVQSVGQRVRDTLWVTDEGGRKITRPRRLGELRVATVLTKHFTQLLPSSPNPESALLHFREFLSDLFRRRNWTRELATLERPEVLENLALLLGVSDFLWSDFLRMQHKSLFPLVRDAHALGVAKSRCELDEELEAALSRERGSGSWPEAWRQTLNSFKDREMFRIDMRQIQGHIQEFAQFSAELTELAEVLFAAAYRLVRDELVAEFGSPRAADGTETRLTVCALGKFGGGELGFASDIELMFIYKGDGETTGERVLPAAEFCNRMVDRTRHAITTKSKGIFEIDLRLRPYGDSGPLAVSLDSVRRYFAADGEAWPYERQALVKLRPVAGDSELGQEVLKLRDQLIFADGAFDLAAMRAMRERQLHHLVTPGTVNAKYSPGGLVDLEYLVQALQIENGGHFQGLGITHTQEAISVLRRIGALAESEARALDEGYRFLRRLIDALRIVRGNAKDLTVPSPESDEFAYLARRLDYQEDPSRLHNQLRHHTRRIRELADTIPG